MQKVDSAGGTRFKMGNEIAGFYGSSICAHGLLTHSEKMDGLVSLALNFLKLLEKVVLTTLTSITCHRHVILNSATEPLKWEYLGIGLQHFLVLFRVWKIWEDNTRQMPWLGGVVMETASDGQWLRLPGIESRNSTAESVTSRPMIQLASRLCLHRPWFHSKWLVETRWYQTIEAVVCCSLAASLAAWVLHRVHPTFLGLKNSERRCSSWTWHLWS